MLLLPAVDQLNGVLDPAGGFCGAGGVEPAFASQLAVVLRHAPKSPHTNTEPLWQKVDFSG
ncbi:MAG TPA: hypothetical protein VN815_09555 [Steroidobacteraceae bacterium]|nr:hypothetical protein [Steroidobacteraceae bacterium]